MYRSRLMRLMAFASLLLAMTFLVGCKLRNRNEPISAVKAGYDTNNLVDVQAQTEAEAILGLGDINLVAEKTREMVRKRVVELDPEVVKRPPKNVLCLSGGGSYGAFSAGILVGWTQQGTRPNFDVVTGISTGALISPFAFLGPKYDPLMQKFYTTLHKKDVYKAQPIRGLLGGESLADNTPLRHQIETVLTPEVIQEIAAEHAKGRRLYVGTTELEGNRFVMWDIGAIATRGGECDRELIIRVLLGSSAIPGFFPPSKIPISVDGQVYIEKHGDGGVSQAAFFHPPYIPPEERSTRGPVNLYGTKLWVIDAGKLYADPEPTGGFSLSLAGKSVSAIIYAQTRGDITRMWSLCNMTGMDLSYTYIPQDFPAPKSATEFEPEPMTLMFNEGVRLICSGQAWRKSPPGTGPGELALQRWGTCLQFQKRGPASPSYPGATSSPLVSPGIMPIPATPPMK